MRFAKDTVGLTDQTHLLAVFNQFCGEVGAVGVGVAARSSQLSMALGEKLLQLHMRGEGDKTKARTIAEKLNREFFHHGYPVSRSEAEVIGLPIAPREAVVEKLIWSIWSSISNDLQLREPVNDIAILKKAVSSAPLFGPVAHIVPQGRGLPVDLAAATQQATIIQVPPVPFEHISALMESARKATRYVTSGLLFGSRMPDLNYRLSKVVDHQGWMTVDLSPDEPAANQSPAPKPKPRRAMRQKRTAT